MEKLIDKAIEASKRSYSPYSKFKVGVALALDNGKIIKGTNVENASYGLSMCAERAALYSAYSRGFKKENIKTLVLYTETENFSTPCGACRQVIVELVCKECEIFLVNKYREVKKVWAEQLLPLAFTKENLKEVDKEEKEELYEDEEDLLEEDEDDEE